MLVAVGSPRKTSTTWPAKPLGTTTCQQTRKRSMTWSWVGLCSARRPFQIETLHFGSGSIVSSSWLKRTCKNCGWKVTLWASSPKTLLRPGYWSVQVEPSCWGFPTRSWEESQLPIAESLILIVSSLQKLTKCVNIICRNVLNSFRACKCFHGGSVHNKELDPKVNGWRHLWHRRPPLPIPEHQ